MIFEAKTIFLKNGRTALLRSPGPEDASSMLHYLKETSSETPFMLRYPEEYTMTDEQEAAFLRSIAGSSNDLMILCEVDGQIVGSCSLSCHAFLKTRHRADVAIGIIRSHWGMGIGTALFHEIIAAAKNRGISQLELEVIEGNDRAMALYHKMGFRVFAERPNSIRLKDGAMLKEYFMLKEL